MSEMLMDKIEQIGPFRIYPPSATGGEWTMSEDRVWINIVLADRDACLMLAGMIAAGMTDEQIQGLRESYNLAEIPVDVTCEHLLKWMAGEV